MTSLKNIVIGTVFLALGLAVFLGFYSEMFTTYGVSYDGTSKVLTNSSFDYQYVINESNKLGQSMKSVIAPSSVTDLLGGLTIGAISALTTVWSLVILPVNFLWDVTADYSLNPVFASVAGTLIMIIVGFIFIYYYTKVEQ